MHGETPRDARLSPQEREIERELGHVAVCIIGTIERIPRAFGDNYGVHPIRVAATKNPRDATGDADQMSPIHPITLHAYVWTESDRDAKRLKAKLEEMLFENSEQLRYGWKNIEEVWIAEILIGEASRELAIRIFDEDARRAQIRRIYEQRAMMARKGRLQQTGTRIKGKTS